MSQEAAPYGRRELLLALDQMRGEVAMPDRACPNGVRPDIHARFLRVLKRAEASQKERDAVLRSAPALHEPSFNASRREGADQDDL